MNNKTGLFLILTLLFFTSAAVRAELESSASVEMAADSYGEPKTDKAKVQLDIFETETGYVFESDLNHGGKVGRQDAWQNEIEYAHRFLLSGNWYLHAGLAYNRFDFGNTSAPVPVHLQSGALVIGIDYMKGTDLGAFIQFKPGFYTEEHVGLAAFDCPITVARFFVLQEHKLYVLVGANGSFLRGSWPVIPVAGLVWIPCDKWRLMGVPPEPRLVYSPNDKLELWIGGEFVGGSFRTDHQNDIVPAKLSGAVVDYYDYRAGVGLRYSPNDRIDLDLGGGCSVQRAFNFERADQFFRTDPAPYVRLEFKAKF
jgi:hypothetical protein